MSRKHMVTIDGHDYEFDLDEIEQAKRDIADGKGVPLEELLRALRQPARATEPVDGGSP